MTEVRCKYRGPDAKATAFDNATNFLRAIDTSTVAEIVADFDLGFSCRAKGTGGITKTEVPGGLVAEALIEVLRHHSPNVDEELAPTRKRGIAEGLLPMGSIRWQVVRLKTVHMWIQA